MALRNSSDVGTVRVKFPVSALPPNGCVDSLRLLLLLVTFVNAPINWLIQVEKIRGLQTLKKII